MKFRLAHVTDLHLSARRDCLNVVADASSSRERIRLAYRHFFGQRDEKEAFFYPSGYNPDAALKAVHTILSNKVDAAVLTGDLATTGEAEDIRIIVDFLCGHPLEWWSVSQAPSLLNETIVIPMPGNHDRFVDIALTPASPHFEHQLGRYWDLGQDLSYSYWLPHEESGRVRVATLRSADQSLSIVMADFSLWSANDAEHGLFAYCGQGKVYERVLRELVYATQKVYEEESEQWCAGVIWAVHFPPECPNLDSNLRLLSGSALVQAAVDANISTILAGHAHRTGQYNALAGDKAVRVICSGPTAGLDREEKFSLTFLDICVPQPGQIVCEPIHYEYRNAAFRQMPNFPRLD